MKKFIFMLVVIFLVTLAVCYAVESNDSYSHSGKFQIFSSTGQMTYLVNTETGDVWQEKIDQKTYEISFQRVNVEGLYLRQKTLQK